MLQRHSKSIIIFLGFLIFGIIILVNYSNPQIHNKLFLNAVALGVLMIYFWIFEVIPIYLTALFPIILVGPMGLIDVDGKVDTSILAKSYGNSMIFVFLGGFMLALALEKFDIHIQIAKGILRFVGNKKSNIVLGFLLSTGLLSMWISNTATALMLLPMGIAVINSLKVEEQNSKFSRHLLLSIAYGASIGGVGTLIGSPPNLQMASILSKQFNIEVDFISWFVIGFPTCVIMLTLTYFYFRFSMGKSSNERVETMSLEKTPWTKNQLKVLAVFLLVVILWSFKDLIALSGYTYSDESVAILGTVLLFLIPADHTKNLLEWSDTQKLPWGILFLFGGGLALADALDKGGVIKALSNSISGMNDMNYLVLLLIIVAIAIFASEVLSNLALVTVLVPIIAAFALENSFSVIQICFGVTLGASLAFMLPIGTPPNAIVFSAGHIKFKQMATAGFVINIISLVVITAMCYLFL
ncbi:MAG: SLC13 family permease [Flavobacteriia bacterium]|jgi:sodium-dependent dicarboxylate transporter 2/3/5